MHHDYLDRHSRLESPIHRLPAGAKLAGALLLVLVTIMIPRARPALFAGVAIALGAIAARSRVPPAFLVRRLLLLEPFVAGVAVMSLFQPNGAAVCLWLLARSTLCLATAILLASTTPFADILHIFRRIRMPALLVTTLALMYRYIFILVDEAERMNRARRSRTFRVTRSRTWRHRAGLIGRLFVRSTERAERIYAAMCARGWTT
jgi:cobalt/nickel transport system permease protein